jgi:serine/threonine-protein kinase
VGNSQGATREVLFQELVALDRACQQRYGPVAGPDTSKEPGAVAEGLANTATDPLCGRRDVAARWPAGWPIIPGLEMVEVLGAGGMGVVFRARQATLNRDVAVKFLRDDHRADPGQRERFLQEARAVARLRHPHLVQVYEFGEVPAAGGTMSRPYLVLEYVPGGSLADLTRGTPQPPAEAARIVELLAEAIHYAHQQGVIHRDLKPANVLLLSGEGASGERSGKDVPSPHSPLATHHTLLPTHQPKVTDFGLAKLLAGSDLTLSGEMLGTPSYMAPEQAGGKRGPITAAVDVYGLGTILYEALTGRPPFAAATIEATLALVRQDEPVTPRRLQPTVPRDLQTICLKCLQKEPGRRYPTALDLAHDLRRFRGGEPIRARPVGPGERVVAWCRRKPVVAGLLAALLLVFLAGSAGVLWQWQRASTSAADYQRERDTARQEKDRAERHLQIVREQVDRLNQLGRDLLRQPGRYGTGQAVLEEALGFYQALLPEEGNDPTVRREAAKLYRLVAEIHHRIGQNGKAAEAFGRQAKLLSSLLKEEPADKALRMELADTYRWWANALRDQGKAREARATYDQAAELHKELLRDYPDEAFYQMALANTLLNIATLLSRKDQADELEQILDTALKLDRAAVKAAPDNPEFKAELAHALEDQGLFFLDIGRGSEAETAVREAVAIYRSLAASRQLPSSIARLVARSMVNLGRVLAVAGRPQEAEKSYRDAMRTIGRAVNDFPESLLRRADLAQTLTGLANLLKVPERQREVEDIRRGVIRTWESLKNDMPEDKQYRRNLVQSYLELVSLLWLVGRQSEAAEPFRKAFEVDPEDHAINNLLAWFLLTTTEPPLRDTARALRLAKKAVDARPETGDYRNTLGLAHYRNGDDKAAVAELETAMRLRAASSFDWFVLAMAHWRLGNHDQARTWFDRAVDKFLPNDDVLRRLRAEAEALLCPALPKQPDTGGYYW